MKRLKIVVGGMIASVPEQGGATWAVLQFVLGLKELGHEVYFLETTSENDTARSHAWTRRKKDTYFANVMREFGLGSYSALIRKKDFTTAGLPYDEIARNVKDADVLVNLSGLFDDWEITGRIPIRIYVDLDPGFTQLWSVAEKIDMRFEGHTHFATVGQWIGTPRCAVPDCGVAWIPLLQPVVLSHWPVSDAQPRYGVTTVANWRGYGTIHHNGVFYGQKAHSFRRLIGIPRISSQPFSIALCIHSSELEDRNAMMANGWNLLNPIEVAGSPCRYQKFIQSSAAEIGIAKSGYVSSRSGWFSDRSVCYLASGRPVIVQDTGLEGILPTGKGLVTFNTTGEAVDALNEISRDYRKHARAARALAQEHFDSSIILGRLLERVGATS